MSDGVTVVTGVGGGGVAGGQGLVPGRQADRVGGSTGELGLYASVSHQCHSQTQAHRLWQELKTVTAACPSERVMGVAEAPRPTPLGAPDHHGGDVLTVLESQPSEILEALNNPKKANISQTGGRVA